MAVNYEKPSGVGLPSIEIPPAHALTTQHRDELEQTLPPTPVRELLAASGASACVLSTDAAFVAVVRQAAGEQYPLSVVETWPELEEAVDAGRCGIAILDAAALGNRVFDCIEALQPYAHKLVTLVAAERAAAADLVGLLAERRIHRLLMKPSAVGATRLLIESAVARRLKLGESAANDEAAPAATAAGAARRKLITVAGAAGVGVALAVAAVVVFMQTRESAAPAAAATTSAPAEAAPADAAPIPSEPLDAAGQQRARAAELVAQADLARAEGRLTEPAGTGALELYLAALEAAPDEALARRGVVAVIDDLFTRAEQAVLAGSLDDAAETLDRIRRIEPNSTRLAFLDAQLVRALAASTPARTAPTAPTAPPNAERAAAATELDSMLTLAAARLRRGQLLSPAGDNARDYLDRARALDPDNARAAALRSELAAALVAAARLVAASDPAAAGALTAEAWRHGADPAELAALETQLAAAQNAAGLAAARELMREGALFTPPADNALAALLAMQARGVETEGLAAAWAEFRLAMRAAIETAAENDEPFDAALAALREAPEGAALATQLAADIEARRLQQRYLAEAVPASELRLLSAPPATYPEEARDAEVQGWVDVEFIVDRAGQTRDGRVVDARPTGTFDAAALAAVAAYRYAPFERDGRVYERRLRLRIRFVLQ